MDGQNQPTSEGLADLARQLTALAETLSGEAKLRAMEISNRLLVTALNERRSRGSQPAVTQDPKALEAETGECPRCHQTGPIGKVFGLRRWNGGLKRQSWCRDCRIQTSHVPVQKTSVKQPRKAARRG